MMLFHSLGFTKQNNEQEKFSAADQRKTILFVYRFRHGH